MPRFFAVNYFQEAVLQQKLLLDRMLIPVPDWFEEKHGSKADFFTNIPLNLWNKDDKIDLPYENNMDDWGVLQRYSVMAKLESYQSEVIFHQTAYGSFELVPSSNPNSQESIDDCVLLKLCSEAAPSTGVEDFYKDFLENFEGISDLLEEPTDINILKEYLHNQFCEKELVQKLKLKVVRDPFVTQDGKDINEMHVFKEDLQYFGGPDSSYLHPDDDSNRAKETFCKEKLLDTERESIEENLVGDIEEDLLATMKSGVFPKDILKDLQTEDTSDELKATDELAKLIVKEVEIRKTDIKPRWGGIETCDVSSMAYLIQKESKSPEHKTVNSKALLESPEELTTSSDCESFRMSMPWRKAQPFLLSLSDAMDTIFLPEKKKNDLLNKVWHQEKILNDMLTFTLPVPSLPENKTGNQPHIAQQKLGLVPENCTAELELALSWDFVASSEKAMEKSANTCCKFTQEFVLLEQDSFQAVPLDKENFEDNKRLDFIDMDDFYPKINVFEMSKPHTEIPAIEQGRYCDEKVIEKVNSVENVSDKSDIVTRDSVQQRSELNPIDEFMFMRRNTLTKTPLTRTRLAEKNKLCDSPKSENNDLIGIEEKPKGKSLKCQEQQQDFTSPQSDFNETYIEANVTPDRHSSKKSKSKVIEVAFTGVFRSVVQVLVETAEPFLSLLQVSGLIPQSQTFTMFTPDVSKFIMTQHEKAIKDRGDTDISKDKMFQAVVVLHILVSGLDSFLHGCLHTSIMTVSSLQDQHRTLLKGVLENVRQQLFEWNHKIQQMKLLHPKVSHVCEALAQWYVRKTTKSPDQEVKILIVCKNPEEHLLKEITEYVQQVEGINPLAETTRDELSYQYIVGSLDRSNCLVISQQQIGDHFPWAQFSLVIEYSYTPLSKIMDDCNRQSIRYIGLKLKTWQSQLPVENKDDFGSNIVRSAKLESFNKQQITVIGSEKLTAKYELLHFMENRVNFEVIERDYSQLNFKTKIEFADVIIDERTCVLLHDLVELKDNMDLQPLSARISAMVLKYQTCWMLLLSSSEEEKKGYAYPGQTIANISKILARVAHPAEHYSVKVLYCKNYNEAAQLIRCVSEDAMKRSVTKNICKEAEWLNRVWLTPDISKKERLWLGFPCLNSFSIQLMLTECPLETLFTHSAQDLMKRFPWLPAHVIELFVDMVDKTARMLHKCATKPTRPNNTGTIKKSEGPQRESFTRTVVSEPEAGEADFDIGLEIDLVPHRSGEFTTQENGMALCDNKPLPEQGNLDFSRFYKFKDRGHRVGRPFQRREIHEALQTPLEFLNSRVKNDASSKLSLNDDTNTALDYFHGQTWKAPRNDLHKGLDNNSLPVAARERDNLIPDRVITESSRLWQKFGRNSQSFTGLNQTHSHLAYSKEDVTEEPESRKKEAFQKMFPEFRTKTRSIAPVTPRVRQPLTSWDINSTAEAFGTTSAYGVPVRQSPPMDYDSDDDYDMSVHMEQISYGVSSHARNTSENYIYNQDANEGWHLSTAGSSAPYKQRKLTYEAVPGSMSSQTRLRFK